MSHSKALLVAPSAESDYNERFTLHLFVKPVSCTTTVMLTFILVCRGVHSILNDGANAPWKKWGERFCRNLGGSALIINALPP